MKLLASKFNEKKFFLRSQLYAWAYVRIWTLRPWLDQSVVTKERVRDFTYCLKNDSICKVTVYNDNSKIKPWV